MALIYYPFSNGYLMVLFSQLSHGHICEKKSIVKIMRYCHNFDAIVFLVVQLLVHLVST